MAGRPLRRLVLAAGALSLAGCLVRLEVKGDRLPLEPPPRRSALAVGLVARPAVEASEVVFRNPWQLAIPGRPRFVVAVGAEVAEALERALEGDFARVVRVAAAPPAELAGVVELEAVEARAWGEGLTYHLDADVTVTVRAADGRVLESIAVRGHGESRRVTVPGGLSEATALAVKQAVERFRLELRTRPATAAWLDGAPPPAP